MVAKAVAEPGQKTKGGTFPLSEVAEVRMRGGDIPAPGSAAEEIVLSAWAAYRYIRALAQRTGQKSIRHARDGWELEMQVQDAFRTVWPAGQTPLPIAGIEHDEARRRLTTWLGMHQNLSLVTRGNPDIRAKHATMSARPSRWWVAEEFSGVPEGMRLPEVSALTGEVLRKRDTVPGQKTEQLAVRNLPVRDWWCPYENQCKFGAPMTEQEIARHFTDSHGARAGSFLHNSFLDDARRLHGTSEAETEAEPGAGASEPEEEPGLLGSLVLPLPAPVPAVPAPQEASPAPPLPAQEKTRTRTRTLPGQVPGGQVSAQARVFAGHVAELEDEIARLRRDNTELRRRLAEREERPQAVTLTAEATDRLARRLAKLIKSENELS